jgi:hypothetical protein
MSFKRVKYGVEYNSRPIQDDSSGIGGVFAVLGLVALVSLTVTLVNRFRSSEEVSEADSLTIVQAETMEGVDVPPPSNDGKIKVSLPHRPPQVRNLLLRLQEAESHLGKKGDSADKQRYLEMAVTTIEQIRALPGTPAADIDDALARRLGTLNMVRLFDLKSSQWVTEAVVKRGASATRVAAEHGSTLSSLVRLNGGGSLEKLRVGHRLKVMNHPRFNLVVHRRSGTADLSLNGKFFKRYYLVGSVGGPDGAYEIPSSPRAFWARIGTGFSAADRGELEMLMPKGASVLISEL